MMGKLAKLTSVVALILYAAICARHEYGKLEQKFMAPAVSIIEAVNAERDVL